MQLEFDSLSKSASDTFEEVLRILGWNFAELKREELSEAFKALVILIDLIETLTNKILVSNTVKRAAGIIEEVDGSLHVIQKSHLLSPLP